MRTLLQKVTEASVSIDGTEVSRIGRGYLLFLGVLQGDSEAEAQWLIEKILKLRLFDGPDGTINDKTILDVGGEILIVSQFTLAGRMEKGNRPDYSRAMAPAEAQKLYAFFLEKMQSAIPSNVQAGQFGAMMQVHLINDGPVTLILNRDSVTAL